MPRRLAAAAMGASTGPPGVFVIGLWQEFNENERDGDGREAAVCFRDNPMLCGVFEECLVLSIVIWMETNLMGSP